MNSPLLLAVIQQWNAQMIGSATELATRRGGILPPSAISTTHIAEDTTFPIIAPFLVIRARTRAVE
jgi:hypothetical protein